MCWAKQIAYIHVASLQAPDETGEEIRGRLLKISYARTQKNGAERYALHPHSILTKKYLKADTLHLVGSVV